MSMNVVALLLASNDCAYTLGVAGRGKAASVATAFIMAR